MEIQIIKFLQSAKNPFYDFVFTGVSFLASYTGFLILLAVLLFLTFCKNKKYLLITVVYSATYIMGVIFNFVLKAIINRPRPYEIDSGIQDSLHAVGQSMPSGHMLSAGIICFFIIFLICYYCGKKNIWLAGITVALFLVLTAISRMYLGQHFISDVLVGFVISVAISFLGCYTFIKLEKKQKVKNKDKENKNEN